MPKKTSSKSPHKPTVRIEFEVEPIVEMKLRALCRMFDLPYPEGIAVVLEKTCALVDKGAR